MKLNEIWMPLAAHQPPANKPFFEGWYYKHTHPDGRVISFIPGIAQEKSGRSHAFIQVIATGLPKPLYVYYPIEQFSATRTPFKVRIGDNVFSLKGCRVNIHQQGISVQGQITYSHIVPLKDHPASPGIMGPTSFVPGLSCLHGVVSLHHRLYGSVQVGDTHWQMEGGSGYIEKDWGSSFPQNWIWMQANRFEDYPGLSFMAAVASIPLGGLSFTGMLCVLGQGRRQRRFATYNLAKVRAITKDENGWVHIIISKGRTMIHASAYHQKGGNLMAPDKGAMKRMIHETPATRMHLTVKEGGKTILQTSSNGAGMECVGDYLSLV